jgi:hypothetical protein
MIAPPFAGWQVNPVAAVTRRGGLRPADPAVLLGHVFKNEP